MRGPTIRRTRRVGAAASATLALVALTTACDIEPPPPPPQFVVNDTQDLPDFDPGDGVCEVTPGQGDCTLRAGVDEGNALGSADLTLDPGTYTIYDQIFSNPPPDHAFEITGTIRITGSGPDTVISWDPDMLPSHIWITTGALTIENVYLEGIRVTVAGDFGLLRSKMQADPLMESAIDVEPTGRAVVQDSFVFSPTGSIRNAGVLLADRSTIGGQPDPTVWAPLTGPWTLEGGTTYLHSTWIASGAGCVGEVISLGYNAAPNESCGLTEATDQTDASPMPFSWDQWMSPPDGTLVDAVPLGEGGCDAGTLDVNGIARPLDGDHDGTAACDIGAVEYVPLVVN